MVLQFTRPWVSDKDIAAGGRWGQDIAVELQDCHFGITCVTPENKTAEWLLFEAGALSKSMAESRVVPLLFEMDLSELTGPLAQFQAKKLDREGIESLMVTINSCADNKLDGPLFTQLVDALYPKLEERIIKIVPLPGGPAKKPAINEVLEELVTAVRSLEARERSRISDFEIRPRSTRRRIHPEMLLRLAEEMGESKSDPIILSLMASYLRDDIPWVADQLADAYRGFSSGSHTERRRAATKLTRLVEQLKSLGPMLMDGFGSSKESYMLLRELPFLIDHSVRGLLKIDFDNREGNADDM